MNPPGVTAILLVGLTLLATLVWVPLRPAYVLGPGPGKFGVELDSHGGSVHPIASRPIAL